MHQRIRQFAFDRGQPRPTLVDFTTGRRYIYSGVPRSRSRRLRAAFAKGRHFNAHIRDHYPYREVAHRR